jgi:hypothetical protein
VAVTAASGACLAAGGGDFTGAQVGDLLNVSGGSYVITAVTDATNINIAAGDASGNIAATKGATVTPVNAIAAGLPTDRSNAVRYMWQPPIGVFDYEGILGSGEYRIQLNPSSRYKKAAVQTVADVRIPGTHYDLVVNDVQFYPWIEKANAPVTGVERLFLSEMNVQSKKFENSGVLDFTVPPSTQQIAVFVQSTAAGSNSRYPQTLFRSDTTTENDMKLENIQITYANKTMPSTNWDSSFSGGTNRMTQRYLDTQIETGMIESPGGCETFADFKSRGGYYMFDFGRDSSDRSTNVQLRLKYTTDLANSRIMICSFYNRVCEITTESGRIVNVQSLSV